MRVAGGDAAVPYVAVLFSLAILPEDLADDCRNGALNGARSLYS